MNPAPANTPAPPAINYLKLTASLTTALLVSLLAAVLFWHLLNDWDSTKAGFIEGYHDGAKTFGS